jgi:(S)-ureidoglycine aminohydrolase
MAPTELPASTRSTIKGNYALVTPAGLAPSRLPGWEKAICNILISPMMGARFTQLLITLEHDGECLGNTGANQYFIYVLEGNASILLDDRRHRLEAGSYVYLPAGKDVQLKSAAAATRILVFQKRYEPMRGVANPRAMVGHEREVKSQAVPGSEGGQSQMLLPDEPAFDMAVKITTYAPGACLPSVETHVMEHGLVMLQGKGVCRLDSDWHPVQAGDVIWTAPYCPQWFVAVGKTPASYICYSDVNRDPM